jgi:hypothetical protein
VYAGCAVTMHDRSFHGRNKGTYLHKYSLRATRIRTSSDAPGGEAWVKVSEDSELDLETVRQLAAEMQLTDRPEQIEWLG